MRMIVTFVVFFLLWDLIIVKKHWKTLVSSCFSTDDPLSRYQLFAVIIRCISLFPSSYQLLFTFSSQCSQISWFWVKSKVDWLYRQCCRHPYHVVLASTHYNLPSQKCKRTRWVWLDLLIYGPSIVNTTSLQRVVLLTVFASKVEGTQYSLIDESIGSILTFNILMNIYTGCFVIGVII